MAAATATKITEKQSTAFKKEKRTNSETFIWAVVAVVVFFLSTRRHIAITQ